MALEDLKCMCSTDDDDNASIPSLETVSDSGRLTSHMLGLWELTERTVEDCDCGSCCRLEPTKTNGSLDGSSSPPTLRTLADFGKHVTLPGFPGGSRDTR